VLATGHPAPLVRSLPLITHGGREELFREARRRMSGTPTSRRLVTVLIRVVLVRYDDALAYCHWLSRSIERAVRLPTEAEWEKAARAGTEGLRYPWGNTIDASCANYLTDPSTRSQRGTRPTGTYPPNGYGLYDVCGNVWEWVADWYSADYYGLGEMRDPRGPQIGNLRLVRGGSWVNDESVHAEGARYRHKVPPDTYAYSVGFRIVCGA